MIVHSPPHYLGLIYMKLKNKVILKQKKHMTHLSGPSSDSIGQVQDCSCYVTLLDYLGGHFHQYSLVSLGQISLHVFH